MRPFLPALLAIASIGTIGAAAPDGLVAKLGGLCDGGPKLPETLSRKASLLLRETCLKKKWPAIHRALRRDGLKLPTGRTAGPLTYFEVPVRKKALRAGGYSFDLVLEFAVKRGPPEGQDGAPDEIVTARARLDAVIADETDEIVQAELFGPGTVLTRLLQSKVRHERDGDDRFLRRIELSYDLIQHHREAEFPFGYHVRLEFGPSADAPARRSGSFTVLSHEDLPRDLAGKELNNWEGWQNTALFDIHYWGGSTWESGK